MNALILAAGYGSRFKSPLKKKPKTLLKIKKKPILHYLIKQIIKSNIKKIYIVIGYKKNLIKQYLKKNFKSKIEIEYIYNENFGNKGNIYSALLAKKRINSSFVLLNADIILPKNLLKKFVDFKKKNAFLVNLNQHQNSDDIKFLYNKNKIVKKVFVKTKSLNHGFVVPSGGVAKFSKKSAKFFFNILLKKNHATNPYYENSYHLLIKKYKFSIFSTDKKIIEIDTFTDYLKSKKILLKNDFYL